MRASEFHLFTTKETPADAEIASHRLMLRAGMIRKLGAGLYSWSPLGLRVLKRVEAIVREEMNAAGAVEMLMPAVQPAELWEESGRWDAFGPLLLKIEDRAGRAFCFGPTHEEVITDFARNEIRSYRQLPLNFYQIQTKFRDEIRPRFGVMRAREFLMKDAYSFHLNEASLERDGYRVMFDAYTRIFTRLCLDFRAVAADSGAIGGKTSHEFHVLAESGEDAIAFSTESDYAANVEMAEAASTNERPAPEQKLARLATPGVRTIADLEEKHGLAAAQGVKTLVIKTKDDGLMALILRGDHTLNALKAEKLPQAAAPLAFADEDAIRAAIGAGPGSLGPVNLTLPFVVDKAAANLSDFACGANEDGYHYTGVNWERDAALDEIADLRNVEHGDRSPDGCGTLEIARGIEVGHIFQLGTKYSQTMDARVLDENGKAVPLWMGCYGIGISRIVAAAIEQNHDDRGIIWPQPIAPFDIALLPMNMHKSQRLHEAADALYEELQDAGVDVLFDDRKLRPGVMFAEQELIGIPHRLVISDKGLDAEAVEYQGRREAESRQMPRAEAVQFVKETISAATCKPG